MILRCFILIGAFSLAFAEDSSQPEPTPLAVPTTTLNAGMNKYQRINHLEEKLISLYKRVNQLESQVKSLTRKLKKNKKPTPKTKTEEE